MALLSTSTGPRIMIVPVVLKTSAMRFPFISWSNFEFEWRLGLTFTSRRITEPVRSSIISNPKSSKQFPWEAQCLWTCCTICPSAAIKVFRTTSKISHIATMLVPKPKTGLETTPIVYFCLPFISSHILAVSYPCFCNSPQSIFILHLWPSADPASWFDWNFFDFLLIE